MRNKHAKVSDPNSFVTCPGDKYHIIYKPKIVDDNIVLVESGKEDIDEKINAWREQTDMSFILHEMEMGNLEPLTRCPGFYADLTQYPDNFIDAMNVMIEAEQDFDSLDVETKQKFDNNFRTWLRTMEEPEWRDKMSKYFASVDADNKGDDNVDATA